MIIIFERIQIDKDLKIMISLHVGLFFKHLKHFCEKVNDLKIECDY